jgi:hypothetical protein
LWISWLSFFGISFCKPTLLFTWTFEQTVLVPWRSYILTVIMMFFVVLWIVVPYSSECGGYQSLRGIYCFILGEGGNVFLQNVCNNLRGITSYKTHQLLFPLVSHIMHWLRAVIIKCVSVSLLKRFSVGMLKKISFWFVVKCNLVFP